MVFEFRWLEKYRCRCILFLGLGQTKIFIKNVLEVFLVNKLSVIGKSTTDVLTSATWIGWPVCSPGPACPSPQQQDPSPGYLSGKVWSKWPPQLSFLLRPVFHYFLIAYFKAISNSSKCLVTTAVKQESSADMRSPNVYRLLLATLSECWEYSFMENRCFNSRCLQSLNFKWVWGELGFCVHFYSILWVADSVFKKKK